MRTLLVCLVGFILMGIVMHITGINLIDDYGVGKFLVVSVGYALVGAFAEKADD